MTLPEFWLREELTFENFLKCGKLSTRIRNVSGIFGLKNWAKFVQKNSKKRQASFIMTEVVILCIPSF